VTVRSVLVLGSAVLLLAGCGTEPSSFEGSDDALRDASTSRMEWRFEGPGALGWVGWRLSGLIDYANSRGDMVINGKSDSAPEARAIFVGRDTYLGAEIDGKMYWQKDIVAGTTGADRFVPGPGGTTPDRLLEDLIESSKEVEKLGSEEIRGVTTTHYRAQLDETKLGADEDEAVAVDAWIDEQGLPRRVRVPSGTDGETAAVADLFDFGVRVDVEAPPASEIVSEERFDELMQKECAKVKAAEDLEDANPLCLLFAVSLESGSDSHEISPTPTATIPTTEGK
jgi:hypothetical protein